MNQSAMPSSQEREAALFALALEKPLTERSAFLQAVCGKDNVLRQRLEALLTAHEQTAGVLAAGSLFGVPPSGGPAAPPAKAGTPNTPAAKATMKIEMPDAPDEAVGQTL